MKNKKIQYFITLYWNGWNNFIYHFFIFVYTFILQKNYSSNTLEAAVDRDIECSDAIMILISNKITQEDFLDISSKKDMSKQRY